MNQAKIRRWTVKTLGALWELGGHENCPAHPHKLAPPARQQYLNDRTQQLSGGLHTRAVTVYRDTLTEGFSHFVASMTAPVASGWSGCRWDLHPLESAAFPRRTPKPAANARINRSAKLVT